MSSTLSTNPKLCLLFNKPKVVMTTMKIWFFSAHLPQYKIFPI